MKCVYVQSLETGCLERVVLQIPTLIQTPTVLIIAKHVSFLLICVHLKVKNLDFWARLNFTAEFLLFLMLLFDSVDIVL